MRQYMDQFLSNNNRADGRKFTDGRQPTISVGTVDTADGSASVKLGYSSCIAGSKGCVVKIESDKVIVEDVLSMQVRLPATWDQQKHNHTYLGDSATTASSLESKLMECMSRCVDAEKLIILPTKYAWKVEVEIIFLDYDGNYEDLAFLAATTCLLNTQLPEATVKATTGESMSDTVRLEDEIIYSSKKVTKLRLLQVPITCTFVELNNNFLLDATSDEESLASGSFSITKLLPCDEIINMNKIGGSPMNEQSIPNLVQAASERCKYLHSCCLKK